VRARLDKRLAERASPFTKHDEGFRLDPRKWSGPFIEDVEADDFVVVASGADEVKTARLIRLLYRHGHGPSSVAAHLGRTLSGLAEWIDACPDRVWGQAAAKIEEASTHRSAKRKRRMASDPAFKLRERIKTRTWQLLRKRRPGSIFDWLPYKMEELVAHIEAQFLPGMNWENYGRAWHVDHKRPVAWFDWNADDLMATLRECWALSNLQPLWAPENSSKGSRYEHI